MRNPDFTINAACCIIICKSLNNQSRLFNTRPPINLSVPTAVTVLSNHTILFHLFIFLVGYQNDQRSPQVKQAVWT